MRREIGALIRPQPAVLLLGPTASGKTPLGDLLENRGLGGRRCRHFDFGSRLRGVAEPASRGTAGLSSEEIAVVRGCLERGLLLENETFGIAAKILADFVEQARLGPDDLLVMNGLPRHVGQARMLVEYVDVVAVLALECDAETVLERIRLDTGGDRAERSDDEEEAVRLRLKTYRERTAPLIEHYRDVGGARVVRLRVDVHASAEELIQELQGRFNS